MTTPLSISPQYVGQSGLPIRAPRYLGRFRCLGPACEDPCCSGEYWTGIPVDPTTVAAYRQLTASGDRRAWRLNLVGPLQPDPKPDPAELQPSALIALERGESCQFFSAERRCSIQETFGEALLPSVCDTFPRVATQVDGRIDLGATLTCPEITRLVLFDEDALTIEAVTADRRLVERGHSWIDRPWPDPAGEDDRHQQYHRIRARSLALLQRPDYPLAVRMLGLGEALKSLALPAYADAGKEGGSVGEPAADVEVAFDACELRLPDLANWLADNGPDATSGPVRPHHVLLRRLRRRLATPAVTPRHRAYQERLRTGLGLPDDPKTRLVGSLGDRVAAICSEAREKHLEPYLARRPYLLENLVANRLWRSTFPFHPERTFAEEHALLAFWIGLVRLQLIGAAAAEGQLIDELVVETIHGFHKYPTRRRFWDWTLTMLREAQALDRASLTALLHA